MDGLKITPMIRQYFAVKQQYPDAILFFRMGDFYEMFFEDAEKASRLLEITLTSRNKNDDTPVPMCGVPYRAAQGYIARLIGQGLKVAVCDQVEDPSLAKGLVKREVVRVITPGMIVDDGLLEASANNYVAALALREDLWGLAHLDLSTGAFRLTQTHDAEALVDEILRIGPAELVLAPCLGDHRVVASVNRGPLTISQLEEAAFDLRRCRERLLEQFQTISLEGFGCQDLEAGICAAGALIHYVRETQKQTVSHIDAVETYFLDAYLCIDDLSCRNLELLSNLRTGARQGTLLSVIDKTVTAMGARLLKNWIRYPMRQADAIEDRLDAVAEAVAVPGPVDTLRRLLRDMADLERLAGKISMAQAHARDLLALMRSIDIFPQLIDLTKNLKSSHFAFPFDPEPLYRLSATIARAIRDDAPLALNEGGMIRAGFDPRLDELIGISRDGKGFLARLEADQRQATGISSLKVRYNKVFGYYIEVPKSQAAAVPPHYQRRQTLANAERYVTETLKDFEAKVLDAESQRNILEYNIFCEVRAQAAACRDPIRQAARFIAALDAVTSLAEAARLNHYTRPRITTDGVIVIEEGRHPVIEQMIAGQRFVPNTVSLDNTANQVLVITGPNMAGKSTVLRQVALTVIMAHMGSFVPASSAAISLTDRIFTRVGALDNLSQGQSTFLVEMQETANILHNATGESLVVLDEIGRGTSTFDGLSIAWAVAEYLHDFKSTGVKTLFATHYHELTELALTHPRVKNLSIAVKEWNDRIVFLHRLVEGGTNRSYGIQVARLAGIPAPVIQRAKKILFDIESEGRTAKTGAARAGARADGPVQLSLFQAADHEVIAKLKRLDITSLTPLAALNLLDDLVRKARGD